MGIFSDMNLADVKVQDNSQKLPEGTYTGFVSNTKVITKKDGSKSLLITYRVEDEDSEHNNWTIDEWRSLPEMVENENSENIFKTEADQRNAQFLKLRLLSLGVREEEMEDIEPKEVIGTPVTFSVKVNGQYSNVRYVATRQTIGDAVSSDLF